jgi:hypothetical protein
MVELGAIGTDGGDGVSGLAFSALFKLLDLSGQWAQVVEDQVGCPHHAHPIPPNHARLEGLG